MAEEERLASGLEEEDTEKARSVEKMKKRLLREAENIGSRGVCYLSRVPRHMNPSTLRHILSQYGEILRIYLAPKGAATEGRQKISGGLRGKEFSEGWVEFADKKIAKRTTRALSGEQIGGKKRSPFYYEHWNIKYLSKFKWDDLTEETANKSAIREQKLSMELSAAKREKDFYLSKVDQAKALRQIEERLIKKQKIDGEMPKVIRQFPQNKPVLSDPTKNKAAISIDILAGVLGGGSE